MVRPQKGNEMSKEVELAREIVDLRWELMIKEVGDLCPYCAYPPKDRSRKDTECTDCDKCVSEWKKVRYAELIQEVKGKYGITESL